MQYNKIKTSIISMLFILLLASGLYPYNNYTKIDLGVTSEYWDWDPVPGYREFFPGLLVGVDSSAGMFGLRFNIGLGRQKFSLTKEEAYTENDINLTYDAFIPYNWKDSYRMGHKVDVVIDFFKLNLLSQYIVDKAFIDENNSKPFKTESLYIFTPSRRFWNF
ncbi:MAG: hypothetical protein KKH98_12455 [Spirochaetes bacterium]|nr:hypothetical protein [Spirochaetota bacterium]